MTALPFIHGSFSLTREWKALPARVFSAWADPEIKAIWFSGPPDEWEVLQRSIDFRVGGREVLEGRFIKTGMVSLYEANLHLIEPDQRLVYAYDMHLNGAHHSVSLSSLYLEPSGDGTKLRYHEQIVFVDGKDGTASRKEGTELLFEQIRAVIMDER